MANIKGSVIITSRDMLNETHGLEAYERAVSMLTEADRKTMTVDLLPTSRYPIDFFVRWLEIVVKVACNGDERGLIARGARGTASQLKGIYKALAFFASPDKVVERLTTVNETYFEGVTTTINKLGPGSHVISYTGLTPRHRLFEYIVLGWWTQILSTTRAKNGKAEIKTSLATGMPLEIALTWDA